jgi:hypothetical protein
MRSTLRATWGMGRIFSMACWISDFAGGGATALAATASNPAGWMLHSQRCISSWIQQVKKPPVSARSIAIPALWRAMYAFSVVLPPISRLMSWEVRGPTKAPPATTAFMFSRVAPISSSCFKNTGMPVVAYFSGRSWLPALTGSGSSRWMSPPTPAVSSNTATPTQVPKNA